MREVKEKQDMIAEHKILVMRELLKRWERFTGHGRSVGPMRMPKFCPIPPGLSEEGYPATAVWR